MAEATKPRAVVTGGHGFIGSGLTARLAAEGYRVLVLDLKPDGPPGCGTAGHEALVLDITSPEAARAIAKFRPHLVVHAAAQTRVAASVADPRADARANVTGTLTMLEAARDARCDGFVFFSSAAIYGDVDALPVKEFQAARPLSPYGVSKLAATRYVEYYRRAGLLPTVTLIPANAYGPGQGAGGDGGVVAAFLQAASRGEELPVEGDGSQTRDFVYVEDIAEGVWRAWGWLRAGGWERDATFNLGTGSETSIAELGQKVERIVGRPLGRIWLPPQPGGIKRSCLSPELARVVLGWTPGLPLDEGLRLTLAWWKKWPGGRTAGPSRPLRPR